MTNARAYSLPAVTVPIVPKSQDLPYCSCGHCLNEHGDGGCSGEDVNINDCRFIDKCDCRGFWHPAN